MMIGAFVMNVECNVIEIRYLNFECDVMSEPVVEDLLPCGA